MYHVKLFHLTHGSDPVEPDDLVATMRLDTVTRDTVNLETYLEYEGKDGFDLFTLTPCGINNSFMTVITRGVPRPDPARESDSGLYEPVQ